jgi:hypothetical protein
MELYFNKRSKTVSNIDIVYNFILYMLFYQFAVLSIVFIVNAYKEVVKEIEEEEDEIEEEEKPIVPYEDKYKDKIKGEDHLLSSKDFLSKESLDNLKNSFVMETTPNGNVLMFWDNDRASFTYYSDTSIPYRYLEVVARKYVIMNNCREIYYIMEEQLKPLKKEEIIKEEEKEEKTVFAKLKSYNQSSIINTKNVPSKKQNLSTHLPRIQINQKEENKNEILLKENANRYSYEGKMINFSFLKKPKKKINENISFSEFKKIQNSIK